MTAPEIPEALQEAQHNWLAAMEAAATVLPPAHLHHLAAIERAHGEMMIAVVEGAAKHQMLQAARKGIDEARAKADTED